MTIENKIVSQQRLDMHSMNSPKTEAWLLSKGLQRVPWKRGLPVLMIIPEDYREQTVKGVPNLLNPSFVIVRHPTSVEMVGGYKLSKVNIRKSSLRAYDTYSIDPTNEEVFHVTPKIKRIGGEDYFLSRSDVFPIDETNKMVLEELGCKFDW